MEFGRRRSVVEFDINESRIGALRKGIDSTLEVSAEELAHANRLSFSADTADLNDCNFFIVTVPTPIDVYNRPDLHALVSQPNGGQGAQEERYRRLRIDCVSRARPKRYACRCSKKRPV